MREVVDWPKPHCRGLSDQFGAATCQEWLEGWFKKTKICYIKRGNLEEFFAWAFYSKYPSELEEAEHHELESMIKAGLKSRALSHEDCELRYGWCFHAGYTQGVLPMRINFDPIQVGRANYA